MKEKLKTTVEEVAIVKNSIGVIINSPIDVDVAVDIERRFSKVIEEIKLVEKAEQKFIKKYGQQMPDGNIGIKPECVLEYTEQRDKLMQQNIELEYDKILYSTIKEQKIKISALDINNLKKDFVDFSK